MYPNGGNMNMYGMYQGAGGNAQQQVQPAAGYGQNMGMQGAGMQQGMGGDANQAMYQQQQQQQQSPQAMAQMQAMYQVRTWPSAIRSSCFCPDATQLSTRR